jgi:epsilon-lactone hydrolase
MHKWLLAAVTVAALPIFAAATYHFATPNQGSFLMKATSLAVWPMSASRKDPVKFEQDIRGRLAPSETPVPDNLRAKYNVTEDQMPQGLVLTIAPKQDAKPWHMLYLHGGAYVNGVTSAHWQIIEQLIEATGSSVTVPLYPLAPENDNRTAYPFVFDLYKHLLETTEPENIVVAGDSAGGNFALGLALEARESGLPLPARLILFSPWLDLTLADPAAKEVEARDPMLGIEALRIAGEWWAAGEDPKSPNLSPLYADLSGLPPIDLFQGANDLFVVDARTFVSNVQAVGGSIRYFEYAGAFHVFVGATWTPEAQDAYDKIAEALVP